VHVFARVLLQVSPSDAKPAAHKHTQHDVGDRWLNPKPTLCHKTAASRQGLTEALPTMLFVCACCTQPKTTPTPQHPHSYTHFFVPSGVSTSRYPLLQTGTSYWLIW
jgi:hypothetical protein